MKQWSLEQIDFPFWVNADILVGPGGGGKIGPALAPAEEAARTKRTFREAIDPTEFFALAKYYFPTCTLSTGWVTGTPTDPEDYRYTMGLEKSLQIAVKIQGFS